MTFDNVVLASLIIFAIGCIIAVPTRANLNTTQGKVGIGVCVLGVVVFIFHWLKVS